MKRTEIEDLILGGTEGLHPAPSLQKMPGQSDSVLRTLMDPEERGMVSVYYEGVQRDWITVLVLDVHGRIQLQKEKRSKAGTNYFQLDLSHLPSAEYRLHIISASGLMASKFSL